MLEVPDQPRPTAELLQIRQLQASGAVLTPIDQITAGAWWTSKEAHQRYTGVVLHERGRPAPKSSPSPFSKSRWLSSFRP
ncbi:MAG: hypothetical protein JWO97_1502 [Acidobacteria bacterium]|nr:hypothetical protein [Acidobacteriota bacterium]